MLQQNYSQQQCWSCHMQAEGVVSEAEMARWRRNWSAAAEAQFAAAGQGKFKESAAQFLISSWQGDALTVGISAIARLCGGEA